MIPSAEAATSRSLRGLAPCVLIRIQLHRWLVQADREADGRESPPRPSDSRNHKIADT